MQCFQVACASAAFGIHCLGTVMIMLVAALDARRIRALVLRAPRPVTLAGVPCGYWLIIGSVLVIVREKIILIVMITVIGGHLLDCASAQAVSTAAVAVCSGSSD